MSRAPRVLIVDDSAVVRQVLSGLVESDPELALQGAVADPILAQRRMEQAWPDVVILDVEMPRMDGLTFLRQIMAEHPTPVVMCSTLTQAGAETTMQALAAGAVEAVPKPHFHGGQEEVLRLLEAVKAAARSQPGRQAGTGRPGAAPAPEKPAPANGGARPAPSKAGEQAVPVGVVALGASTGGTNALEVVLAELPPTCPGLVIVQHMPAQFTTAFAARLNQACAIEVREAANGDAVRPGRALISPGDRHMQIKGPEGQYQVQVRDGPLVSRHRPAVDVLFQSVARQAGPHALGIIMTGMGDDGVHGLDEMRRAGAAALAQDEASSVVYGMPHEALERGAATQVIALSAIAARIQSGNPRGRTEGTA